MCNSTASLQRRRQLMGEERRPRAPRRTVEAADSARAHQKRLRAETASARRRRPAASREAAIVIVIIVAGRPATRASSLWRTCHRRSKCLTTKHSRVATARSICVSKWICLCLCASPRWPRRAVRRGTARAPAARARVAPSLSAVPGGDQVRTTTLSVARSCHAQTGVA